MTSLTALGTSPEEVERRRPRGPSPWRRTWRTLTSMRTALLLLFLLALAAVPGSLLPQYPVNPVAVRRWVEAHPRLAPVVDALGGFDVYASPLFLGLYVLLGISLVGCLTPRIRLHARALRARPPAPPATFARLPESAAALVADPPGVVLDRAARRLRGWRVERRPGAVSAERGYARETGNLCFHVALLALLGGVALGWFGGYDGRVLVVEGDTFTNTEIAYDDFVPGRLYDPADLPPFSLTLRDFRATYLENGQPTSFTASVLADGRPADVEVNHPLSLRGARVYLLDHGYAPVLTIRDPTGAVIHSGPTPCLPAGPNLTSTCVVKVPDPVRGPQLGIRGVFFPSVGVSADGAPVSRHPDATAPALRLEVYAGDLGLDSGVPQGVYQLDTSRMVLTNRVLALPGQRVTGLPGGATLTYEATREWATFQVTRDPGKLLVLGAAVAMLLGLAASLRVRRRRVWVRAVPEGAATLVEVGGLARNDPAAFHREFALIAAGITGREEHP